MKKSITLVTGSEHTRIALLQQLRDYLPEEIEITSYAIDVGINNKISDNLVILSSSLLKNELLEANLLDENCEIITAKRTINFDYIDELVFLPPKTKVLFVNDMPESTFESIDILKKIGIDYLEYIPYYPGNEQIVKDIDIAITPGEIDKVPKYIKKIINIQVRIIDFESIIEILRKLDILDERANLFSHKYLKKIINMAKRLANSNKAINELNNHLNLVIDGLKDGILVYNSSGTISVFNENLKKLLNIHQNDLSGKNIKNVFNNKSLIDFLTNNLPAEDKILTINETEILINKFYVTKDNSAIAVFKNLKETIEVNDRLKRELIKKGLYAKYTFDDIIGTSENIKKVKDIAKKLAKSELTILIEGESGTGKELFASSIHNESKRRNGPFLAVNFSALPEELIESELFGYEEGAFTGAKKGGKAGLFELADGGTIFLDEIGDVSLKIQSRLLRVLQEKEVMRIGGTEIKPINVRVIAATNKNLAKMAKEKQFREDLFYRLKMGYISIPPLRDRKKDIPTIMEHFIKQETTEDIRFSPEVIDILTQHQWLGNIRELKNTIMYIMAVKESNYITLKDIPDKGFFQQDSLYNPSVTEKIDQSLDNELKFILQVIYNLNKSGRIAGRETIEKAILGTAFELTRYQIRNRLEKLENMGLIIKKRGRHGTVLSEKGANFINSII
ncbi:Fis family transcriptional regulator [Fervidicella metallireducens AeB]|uniref:Fis family transcriptional regulator n=1 Tax=Fervidicella metallireducens AeB TaxID=1403537 RepID=A0A017RVB4_9CLOT|nr:sigma 54-interacting transcriptional regulator [Fervidicella metallireducens]EYE88713.1 Fis family transcriptional regulator [Fervidicella metallireducens AeB]